MIPAVIVAGGRGERMGAATDALPKPMLSLGGRPILERLVVALRDAGWRDIDLCLGYRADAVVAHFGDGARLGVRLRHHVESAPRGTAGAVADLREELGDEMLVVYGDLLVAADLRAFAEFFAARPRAAAALALIDTDHPHDSDLARLEGERVSALFRDPAARPPCAPALAALWAVRGPVLDLISRERPSDFGRDAFPEALRRGLEIVGWRAGGELADLGTPERLARARARLERA